MYDNRLLTIALLICVLLVSNGVAVAQDDDAEENKALFVKDDTLTIANLVWEPFEVPGFPLGMKIASVDGDPSLADKPYTFRLAWPDGYKAPPHWHPVTENITILKGGLLFAVGSRFDDSKLKLYTVGDYIAITGKERHYSLAKGDTIVQIHGIGPFEVFLVEG